MVGLILMMYGGGSLVGTFIGGRLTDRIGALPVMVVSLLSTGLGILVLGHLQTANSLLLGMFLVGLCGESYRPAAGTELASLCPAEQRARAYGLNRMAVNLGSAVGPAAGGYLALVGYEWLFRIDGVTCILAGFAMLKLRGAAHTARRSARKSEPKTETDPADSPWRDGHFLAVMFMLLLVTMVFFQFLAAWPLYLREEHGLNEAQIGLLISLNGLLIVTVEMILIHKTEHLNPLRVLSWGCLLVGLGFCLLPFGKGFLFLAATVVIWTFGEMLIAPITSAYTANRSNDNNRGRYMGIFNMAFSVAFLTGPALGTWVYGTFSADILWYATGVVGVLTFLGYQRLAR